MFTITSTHKLVWPGVFKLKLGENKFSSADKVPAAVRAKLVRFAERGVVKFDVPADWSVPSAGKPRAVEAEDETEPVDGPPASLDGFDPATVELNATALGKLKVDQLKLVAAELDVDVSAAKTKQALIDALLAEANGSSQST